MTKFSISKTEKLPPPNEAGDYWFGQPGGECLAILISLGEREKNLTRVGGVNKDRYFISIPGEENGVVFSSENSKELMLFDTPQMAFAWVRAKYGRGK